MSEVTGLNTWRHDLASLVDDTGIRYAADPIGVSTPSFEAATTGYVTGDTQRNDESAPSETLKDQVKGFAMAWGEIALEFGRGCRDIVQQSLLTEDSYIVRKLRKPCARASAKVGYLNEFLPEDRDPAHAWPIVFFVFVLALAGVLVFIWIACFDIEWFIGSFTSCNVFECCFMWDFLIFCCSIKFCNESGCKIVVVHVFGMT